MSKKTQPLDQDEDLDATSMSYTLPSEAAPHVTAARLRDARGPLPAGVRVEVRLLFARTVVDATRFFFSCTYHNAPGNRIHFRALDTELVDYELPPHLELTYGNDR